MFCPKLHSIPKNEISHPLYSPAMEYQTKERMTVIYTDFYSLQKDMLEVKPGITVQQKLKKKYDRYRKTVENRKKYLSPPEDKENREVGYEEIISKFEEEKGKELWECSYSSSTDTEDDEDESDEEAFDIVEEAVHEVQLANEDKTRKYLLNVDDRYIYDYSLDKLKRKKLIIQDTRQWKKRSFSCCYKEREIKFDKLLDEYLEKHPEEDSSSSSE
jgi:hypothetical protein